MTTEIIGKTCTGCGSFKLFADFYPHRRGKHGFGAACRNCTNNINKSWRKNNEERDRELHKAYRIANAESIRQRNKQRRESSEEYKASMIAREERAAQRQATREDRLMQQKKYQSEYAKAYRLANRAKILLRNAAYKIEHPEVRARYSAKRSAYPERSRAYNKAYREANRSAHRVYDQNKRVVRTRPGQRLSVGLSEKLYKLQKGKCPCCNQQLGDDYHLDHKMPLALGGTNTDDNMQLLRAVCNMQKHAQHPVDFMQSRGFLL